MSDLETRTWRSAIRDLAWYWLPLLAWMGMIFYLSAQPDLPSPPEPWLNKLLSNGAHFGVYAVLAFLWWRALQSLRDRPRTGRGWQGRMPERLALAVVFLATALYGVSDEFHQSFVPGRHASLLDLLVDVAGAATALWVVWWRRAD